MHAHDDSGLSLTRRRFFARSAGGLSAALAATACTAVQQQSSADAGALAAAATGPHFQPRAKRVIYLHMEGGPSHLDLFDHKPRLHEQYDKDLL